jgi:hypothetical protein
MCLTQVRELSVYVNAHPSEDMQIIIPPNLPGWAQSFPLTKGSLSRTWVTRPQISLSTNIFMNAMLYYIHNLQRLVLFKLYRFLTASVCIIFH